MTLPLEGLQWGDVYGYNPLGVRKGIITHVLMRDYHGSVTDLRDPLMGLNSFGYMSPYAEDGLYRDDLLSPDFPGGQFYELGGLGETGTEITPDVNVEGVKIAQSKRAVRWDITEENDEIMFVLRESSLPTTNLLRFDLPLANVPDIGKPQQTYVKPSESRFIERQIIALAEDGDFRFAYIFPRTARKKVGKTALNTKDPDDLELTYGALVCPFADTPVYVVHEGQGYRALGGAPKFYSAPVATAGGTGAATVVFTIPRLNDPAPDTFTYAYEKKVGAGSWVTAGSPASTSATSTQVTAGFTGLAAGSTVFRVKATHTASTLVGTSNQSNAVTIT